MCRTNSDRSTARAFGGGQSAKPTKLVPLVRLRLLNGPIMRWFWIDRFEKFVAGKEAVTIKNITLSEEPLDDYLPGCPHYPHSLIIEGMAQTGGLLLSQTYDFHSRVVLAKVSKSVFHRLAAPGEQLRFTAHLVSRKSDGAMVEGHVDIGDQRVADIELTFATLDSSFGDTSFFNPSDLCRMLRSLRLFDVGVTENGQPIRMPQYLLDEELETLSSASI